MNLSNPYRYYLAIVFVVVVGFWQVSFLSYGLKWDLIDVVLPFRYYFSESLSAGYFPFWNPYQQTGTPFYADLQAPTYYPELLMVSLLGKYGVYTMHGLFVLYLLIAAVGMYKLSFHFNGSRNASFVAALSYVFSGYVVGHGQHFFLLVGVAWIPLVILSYLQMNQRGNTIDSIRAGLFVFLLVTGAYQALSIVMLYLLFLLLAYFVVDALVRNDRASLFRILKMNPIFFLVVSLLSLPLIVSTLETLDSVERLSGVSLEKSLAYGQPFTSFLSWLAPSATLKYNEFFGNRDISTINHYFGIIALIFLCASMLKKHSILEYLILGFGLIVFSMSFDFLPIRKFMFEHVPMMDLFLNASYLRVYGLLAFILMAVRYFALLEESISKERKRLIFLSSVLLFALLVLIGFSTTKVTLHDFQVLAELSSALDILKAMSFYQNILIQASFHALVVAALMATIFFYHKIKYPIAVISVLITSELVFSSQLNAYATVVDMQHKPQDMRDDLALCPEGFPLPADGKVVFNDLQHAYFEPFWRNTYIFTKQVSFTAFSSFELKTYSKLDDECVNLRSAVLDNHLAYFSDSIVSMSHFNDSSITSENVKHLFLFQEDYDLLSKLEVQTDSSDRIIIKQFTPNEIVLETTTKNDQFLSLLQTHYKGWKAFVDEAETPIYTSNFNYRTVLLPEGGHVVKFVYKNEKIIVLYVLSNTLFFLLVLFLLSRWLHRKRPGGKLYLLMPLALASIALSLAFVRFSKAETHPDWRQHYGMRFPDESAYMAHHQNFERQSAGTDSLSAFAEDQGFVVDSGTEYFPIVELVQDGGKIKAGTLKLAFKLLPSSYGSALIVSEIKGKWHGGRIEKQIEGLNRWNNVLYLRRIPEMEDGEVLKIYLWNPNHSHFVVDSISVEAFE